MVIRDQGIINGNDISLMDLWVFFGLFLSLFKEKESTLVLPGLSKAAKVFSTMQQVRLHGADSMAS
jgi:hypothetical protein